MALATPLNIHWEVTNRCNLDCVHCYQQDDTPRHKWILPRSALLHIARELVAAKPFEVTVTGGEIFLVKESMAIVELLSAQTINVTVTTNGTKIDVGTATRLADLNVRVQISLDSSDEHVHDKIRGRRGAFQRAIAGIRYLKSAGVEVSIAYTAMEGNVVDVDGLANLAYNLEVSRMCIGEVLPFYSTNARRTKLHPGTKKMKTFTAELIELREKWSGKVALDIALEAGNIYDSRLPRTPCSALVRDLAILFDGWAYPCPFVRGASHRLGNVLESSIAEIWNSPAAARFRVAQPLSIYDIRCPAVRENRTISQWLDLPEFMLNAGR